MSFSLSEEAAEALVRYPFPGNVRELRNIIERVTVLTPASKIQLWDLPMELRGMESAATDQESCTLAEAVNTAERACILKALRTTGGNKTEAAAILGISRKNLWEKMKQYDL